MVNINISNPNDGLGDKVRDAFFKVNNNFSEIGIDKADLINGKVPLIQLPSKTVSTLTPTGIPANGDEWIIYNI